NVVIRRAGTGTVVSNLYPEDAIRYRRGTGGICADVIVLDHRAGGRRSIDLNTGGGGAARNDVAIAWICPADGVVGRAFNIYAEPRITLRGAAIRRNSEEAADDRVVPPCLDVQGIGGSVAVEPIDHETTQGGIASRHRQPGESGAVSI